MRRPSLLRWLALVPISLAVAAGASARPGYDDQVLNLLVTSQRFDERRPWAKRPPRSRSGSALVVEGAAALDSTVADVCSKLRISCRPDDDVKLVMEAMTQRRIRHVPVLVDDELGGIISMGDIVKLQLDEMKIEVGVLRDYARSH